MTSTVHHIKFLSRLSFIFALLSYIVSINMELHFLQLHYSFLSNSFVFAIFSGVFVSSFVVLLVDIYEYLNKKKYLEQILWINYGNLYGQFLSAQYNIKRALNTPQQLYPHMLRQQMPALKSILATIQTIDYTIIFNYCHRNLLEPMHKNFIQMKLPVISSIVDSFVNFELAINTDNIKQLKKQINNSDVVEKPLTHETLIKIEHQLSIVLKTIDDVLAVLEKYDSKRFRWQDTKTKLISFQENYCPQKIEDFLKEDLKTL